MEKDEHLSKDDHARMDAEVQKATDQHIAEIDQMMATKEREILTV
jgi:ribosome recycling factor